jgi:hypothetical protein
MRARALVGPFGNPCGKRKRIIAKKFLLLHQICDVSIDNTIFAGLLLTL